VLGAVVVLGLVVAAGVAFLLLSSRPAGIDHYLSDLKGTDPDARAGAVAWLADADPEDGYRAPVTAALEPLLLDGDRHGKVSPDDVLRAYLHWASRDNVPALVRLVDNPGLPGWDAQKTALAMQTLGSFQDARAAEVLTRQLPIPALHDAAVSALKLMGPAAQPAVLECLFDENPDTRQRASGLLAAYHTKSATIAAAALAKLKSNSPEVRRTAAEWFAENAPDDDSQKAEVATALTRLLDDLSPKDNGLALRALALWATKDSLQPVVAFALRQTKVARGSDAAVNNGPLIDVLAQFPDAAAAAAIAPLLADPVQRGKAAQALLKLGSVSSEAVLAYFNHPEPEVHREARRLAKALGVSEGRELEQSVADLTDGRKSRTLAALQYLAKRRPDDASRAKVSRALNAPLLDADRGIREEAADALLVWATNENTTALVTILGSFQGRSKEDLAYLDKVFRALAALGPGTEDAVAPLLQSSDRLTRVAACRILAEVGTVKSVKPLREAVDQFTTDQVFLNEARAAIAKASERK
jgi:hypothetical protein